MEKALLNVTRFNSADVIATSGAEKKCNHRMHFELTELRNDGTWDANKYVFKDGKWTPYGTIGIESADVPGAKKYDIVGNDFAACSND